MKPAHEPCLGRVSCSCPQSPTLALQRQKADSESCLSTYGRKGGVTASKRWQRDAVQRLTRGPGSSLLEWPQRD